MQEKNMLSWNSLPAAVSSEMPVKVELPVSLYCFYAGDDLGKDGFPQNGSLWEDGSCDGCGACSFFDVTAGEDADALLLIPEKADCSWQMIRHDDRIFLSLPSESWSFHRYHGNEPDWTYHSFPFHNLPDAAADERHGYIRGLLDFLAGTRRSPANGIVFQSPNTSIGKGYSGDGIPDTFFQFISVYPFLSEKRKAYFRSQIDWLGNHLRFDGCVPWGGCRQDVPYYHIWKRTDCGMFFDANGLWLEMTRLLYHFDHIMPSPEKVIRTADFYLHYMTENGLVAAESKMRGCEWADLLQSGWHSSLINVLAFRGLLAASELMTACHQPELAQRYCAAASRLKKSFNLPLEQGGLFTGNGFADWRSPDGTVHPHWRIDTNMLACLWNVADEEKQTAILNHFRERYFRDEPAVPAPYLLEGSWFTRECDDMLDEIRTYGCGTAAMPGRMCGPLIAAMRKAGDMENTDRIHRKLLELVLHEKAVWEYYDHEGKGYAARSYIEHSVSLLYTRNLMDLYMNHQ